MFLPANLEHGVMKFVLFKGLQTREVWHGQLFRSLEVAIARERCIGLESPVYVVDNGLADSYQGKSSCYSIVKRGRETL